MIIVIQCRFVDLHVDLSGRNCARKDPRRGAGERALGLRPRVAPAAGERGVHSGRPAGPPVRAVAAAPDRRCGFRTTRLNHPAFYACVFDSGIAVGIRALLLFFVRGIGTREGREGARQAVRARFRTTAKRVKVARRCEQLCMAAAAAGSTERFFSRVSCGLSASRHEWWSGRGPGVGEDRPVQSISLGHGGHRRVGETRSDSHATAVRRLVISLGLS